ncbi:MAG: hypothetical protein ACRD3W_23590 [Terriglobales bacterium]
MSKKELYADEPFIAVYGNKIIGTDRVVYEPDIEYFFERHGTQFIVMKDGRSYAVRDGTTISMAEGEAPMTRH